MEVVRVPLLNANEDEVRVVDVAFREGDSVRTGEILCLLESTKATMEVEAPITGFVRHLTVRPGDRVRVGEVICLLTQTVDAPVDLPEREAREGGERSSVRATRKAEELAERHEVDLASLAVDGIIRERDVLAFLQAGRSQSRNVAPTSPDLPAHSGRGERILIFGAGGHGRALIDLVRQSTRAFQLVAVVDDSETLPEHLLGVPVYRPSSRLRDLRESGVRYAGLGVGAVTRNQLRIELFRRLEDHGFIIPNLLHPRAVAEPSVVIGEGNQVFAGAVLGSNVRLHDNVIVNSGSVLSHDCVIGSHSHVAPGAILAGGVTVGENTVIGMGVTVYLGVNIGHNVVIANGVNVTRDVPDGAYIKGREG